MSVWRCREIFKGRRGSLKEGMQREFTRVFHVFTTSKLDGPIEVMFAVDPNTAEAVPAIYSIYTNYGAEEFDLLAICRSVDPVQDDDDWSFWVVTCTYSTESITGDGRLGQPDGGDGAGGNPGSGSGSSNDPSLEPPVQEWGNWTREEAQEHAEDDDETPFLNSATEPFENQPTREVGGTTLIIERNELTYDPREKNAFRFTINDADFIWEGDYRQWLCKPITATRQYKGPLKYWRVRYEFHHCGDITKAWNHVLLDAGFSHLVGGVRKEYRKDGQPMARPWPLDGAGAFLTEAEIAAGDVNYLQFKKYLAKDWSSLNIVVDA